jgi:hypothetical protein
MMGITGHLNTLFAFQSIIAGFEKPSHPPLEAL